MPVATARTLPASAPLAISITCRSSLVAVVLPISGTTPRWRTGPSSARPTLLQALTWMPGATSPRLSGSHPPRSDATPPSALLAVSSPSHLGSLSATTALQVSRLDRVLSPNTKLTLAFFRKLWWPVRPERPPISGPPHRYYLNSNRNLHPALATFSCPCRLL